MHPHPLRRLLSSRCQTPFCQAERLPREAASPPPPSARHRRHDGGRASERRREPPFFKSSSQLKCLRRWENGVGGPESRAGDGGGKWQKVTQAKNEKLPTTCGTSARRHRREQMHLDKYLSAGAETLLFFFHGESLSEKMSEWPLENNAVSTAAWWWFQAVLGMKHRLYE